MAFNGRKSGYAGLSDDRLPRDDSGKGCGGDQPRMLGNAMEWQRGKNHGNGLQPSGDDDCGGKKNPIKIIFYLVKVISPVFLDSARTLRIPRIRKIHTRLQERIAFRN